MTARADGELPVRSMESVSIRDIGSADPNWSWKGPSSSIGGLANARGIDREFALRELVTPQTVGPPSGPTRTSWRNWLDDYERTNVSRERPNDAEELREAVTRVVKNDKTDRIRAVGAGHSHSRAAEPKTNYIELSRYTNSGITGLVGDRSERWQKSNLSNVPHFDPNTHQTRRLGAGNSIKYLNRIVLQSQQQALPNMGSYDAQTLAGAVNTSTHGTGLDLGTIADLVLSAELVTVTESPAVDDEPLVRHFRIEPTEGITDREAFEDAVGDHGMTLVQDDEIFHSAVVGYGAMGVATAYTLKVRDRFYLRQTTEVRTWDSLKNDLNSYFNDPAIRQFQILLNTQSVHDPTTPNQQCLITKWGEEPWQANPPERDTKPALRKLRDEITGGGVDPLTPNPLMATLIAESYFKNQQDGPQFQGDYASASYIALRRLRDNNHMNADGPPSDPQLGMSTEIAVPVEKVDEAMDRLIANAIDDVSINGNKVRFSVPTGIRFTAASPHKLSPEYKEPNRSNGVAMIEVPFNVQPINEFTGKIMDVAASIIMKGIGPPKAVLLLPDIPDALAQFLVPVDDLLPSQNISQQQMLQYSKQALPEIEGELLGNWNARPHMGKFNTIGMQGRPAIDDIYPADALTVFQRVLKQFNAFGTFNNSFTEKLDLSVYRDSSGPYTPLERGGSP